MSVMTRLGGLNLTCGENFKIGNPDISSPIIVLGIEAFSPDRLYLRWVRFRGDRYGEEHFLEINALHAELLRKNLPKEDYSDLVKMALSYSQGDPLSERGPKIEKAIEEIGRERTLTVLHRVLTGVGEICGPHKSEGEFFLEELAEAP